MQTQTVELTPLDIRAALSGADEGRRTVNLVFSTGADVLRSDWAGKRFIERLSLDPQHVRLGRLNAGAPLLNSHSAMALTDQLGIVVEGSAIVTGRQGRATVRFSRRADVEPVFRDVLDKVIRNVSVGYRVHRFEESGRQGDLPVRLATDWEPYEISLVPMGADAGAGVRSAAAAVPNPCVLLTPGAGDHDARAQRVQRARRMVAECEDRDIERHARFLVSVLREES